MTRSSELADLDRSDRLAVLTGAGERSFMAGADLNELATTVMLIATTVSATTKTSTIDHLPISGRRIKGACGGPGARVEPGPRRRGPPGA